MGDGTRVPVADYGNAQIKLKTERLKYSPNHYMYLVLIAVSYQSPAMVDERDVPSLLVTGIDISFSSDFLLKHHFLTMVICRLKWRS